MISNEASINRSASRLPPELMIDLMTASIGEDMTEKATHFSFLSPVIRVHFSE
jgi:hypothetical protein